MVLTNMDGKHADLKVEFKYLSFHSYKIPVR